MGRRNRLAPVNRNIDGNRASIGDFYVEATAKAIDRTALAEMNCMLPRTWQPNEIIKMGFHDADVEKMRQVKNYIQPVSSTGAYVIAGDSRGAGKQTLYVDFTNSVIPTPTQGMWTPYGDRIAPFRDYIRELAQIREKYAAVKYLLRWFNRNATPAAVRALWPSVLALCPTSPMCKEYAEMPSRYVSPDKIGELLPLLRDTAQTVAAMQLIPDDLTLRIRSPVRLTFSSGAINREGCDVHCDELTVNL